MIPMSMGSHSYPGRAEAHHIFGVADFDTPLGRRLQAWGIDLNGTDNGVWLPRDHYPGRTASLHRGRTGGDYIQEVNRRLGEATNASEARTILGGIRDDLLNGTLQINRAQ